MPKTIVRNGNQANKRKRSIIRQHEQRIRDIWLSLATNIMKTMVSFSSQGGPTINYLEKREM